MKPDSQPTDRDVLLTAHALGEATPEQQRKVEAYLKKHPEAREELRALQALGESLRAELHAELAAAAPSHPPRKAQRTADRPRLRSRRPALAAAAAVLMLGSLTVLARQWMGSSPEDSSPPYGEVATAARPALAAPSVTPPASSPAPSPASAANPPAWLYDKLEAPGSIQPELLAFDMEPVTALGYLEDDSEVTVGVPLGLVVGRGESGPTRTAVAAAPGKDRLRELGYVDEESLEAVVDGPGRTEAYDHVPENDFVRVADDPRSTFSIDVDTAAYSNLRRFLTSGQLPPPGAIRIEEMLNYFTYSYPDPTGAQPFSVTTEVAGCPWAPGHQLVQLGLKTRALANEHRRPSNLVFLLDVSGSMNEPSKLPLVQRSLKLLVDQLDGRDRVAIVVYAGASGLVLPSTSGTQRAAIMAALDRLQAGGSTHGSAGIQLAYQVATDHFLEGGNNRVILATDGDFNVGITDQSSLVELIAEMSRRRVFLSVLGFGMGNLKDDTLEKLADHGNGHYAYIDTLAEARRVLVEQMGATLETVAKDVKIQVEFNPAEVAAYRLIGYENRVLAHRDFNDDTKDAGDMGAGHTVTALYEVVPIGAGERLGEVDPLKYQRPTELSSDAYRGELMSVKLRYKLPDEDVSQLLETMVYASSKDFSAASGDFQFAAGVAAAGMELRNSRHKGASNLRLAQELLLGGLSGEDAYRSEFAQLMKTAQELRGER